MKNPLHYQLSEYDCGPTSMLNAVSYLFQREEVPPEIIRNITLFAILVYELVGPMLTKMALMDAGEIQPMSADVKNRRQINLENAKRGK